jgi:ApbE superfamily uncharacterized protein (UPF0280 family)
VLLLWKNSRLVKHNNGGDISILVRKREQVGARS